VDDPEDTEQGVEGIGGQKVGEQLDHLGVLSVSVLLREGATPTSRVSDVLGLRMS
jgi:hypothetical protein